jgi:hypothetical protein
MRAAILLIAAMTACMTAPTATTTQDDRSDPFCLIVVCDGTSTDGDATCEATCGFSYTCSHAVIDLSTGVVRWYCTDELNQ